MHSCWQTTVKMLQYIYAVVTVLLVHPVLAGSLADIKHVVLFMQENRAFDHVGSFRTFYFAIEAND